MGRRKKEPAQEPEVIVPEREERELTVRQRTFVRELINGKSGTEAAEIAGYADPNSACTRALRTRSVQRGLKSALVQAGLDDAYLCDRLKELCEASDTDENGNVRPNWPGRARGLDLLARLHGHMKVQVENVNLSFEQRLLQITFSERPEGSEE